MVGFHLSSVGNAKRIAGDAIANDGSVGNRQAQPVIENLAVQDLSVVE